MITVIEGNKGASSVVGYRSVPINGRYIRGFVRPNFDGVSTAPPNSSSGNYGLYKVNSSAGLNVRKGPGTNYARITTLSNGTPLRIVEMSGNWGRSVGAGGWVVWTISQNQEQHQHLHTHLAARAHTLQVEHTN